MLGTHISAIFSLIILFYVLGKAADLIVINIRAIAERFGIKIFFLGLILGFLTSLPELSIGINAIAKDISEISLGNLLGGIVVLFGLILGGSAVINRRIATNGEFANILLILGYIYLPLLLGLDGDINLIEALILIGLYFFLIYHFYKTMRMHDVLQRFEIRTLDFIKKIFFVIGGLAAVIIVSNLIVRLTLFLLEDFQIPSFIVGLVFFSLGTNLPEIIVTIRSSQKHIKELSLSNLIGSAMANALIIGILAVMKTIPVAVGPAYYSLIFLMLILFAVMFNFYKSGRAFTRKEGFILIGLYIIFILTQTNFLILK